LLGPPILYVISFPLASLVYTLAPKYLIVIFYTFFRRFEWGNIIKITKHLSYLNILSNIYKKLVSISTFRF